MSNRLKKIFNMRNCTIAELKNILIFYRKRARVNCDLELEDYINKLFLYCYKPSKLQKKYPQNNYCLLGIADITSKLVRESKNYDKETKDAIFFYLEKLQNYYLYIYDNRDKMLSNYVFAVSLIDRLVTLEKFDNVIFIDNLSEITDRMFGDKFSTLELKDGIADETFNDSIKLIATDPYALPLLDMFGIDVPRNDKVLDIFKENLITTESKYLRKKREEKSKNN